MKFIVTITAALLASPVIAAVPISGKWMTQERDSIIEIGNCGTTVCGKVHRVLKMMPNGQFPIDANNPDAALRGRSVQGIYIFTGFIDGGDQWNGRLYDPKTGRSYRSKLSRNPNGTLNVQGCVAFICKSFTWTAVR